MNDDIDDFAGWTVVDLKTDWEFEEASDRYVAQVRAYSRAVARATRSPRVEYCWLFRGSTIR